MTEQKTSELYDLTACEIAQSIRSRAISAREVVEAHIRRIEAVNPSLNAVVFPLFEQAREDARKADEQQAQGKPLGLLHGVPITVKDQFEVKGTPSTWGLSDRATSLSTREGLLLQRLREAGAIILGKTNVSQLLYYNAADNPLYGRTNNPWNLTRTPGGSSGGEAAIIAARGSALGLGGDLGGSLRVPAHFCGLATLKPTARRLTSNDMPAYFGDSIQTVVISQAGPMARTTADLTLAMRVLAAPGQEQFDPDVPPVPWQEPERVHVEGLRVAVYVDDGVGTPVPAIQRATREAAEALRAQGIKVEEWRPPDLSVVPHFFLGLLGADGGVSALRHLGRNPRASQIQGLASMVSTPPLIRSLLATALTLVGQRDLASTIRSLHALTVDGYWRLTAELYQFQHRFLASLEGFDAILCPPYAFPALPHNLSDFALPTGTYNSLFNLLGLPAGVVPATTIRSDEEDDSSHGKHAPAIATITHGSTGLPVGVQVVAPHWREDIVLALMATLEAHFRTQPDFPLQPPSL